MPGCFGLLCSSEVAVLRQRLREEESARRSAEQKLELSEEHVRDLEGRVEELESQLRLQARELDGGLQAQSERLESRLRAQADRFEELASRELELAERRRTLNESRAQQVDLGCFIEKEREVCHLQQLLVGELSRREEVQRQLDEWREKALARPGLPSAVRSPVFQKANSSDSIHAQRAFASPTQQSRRPSCATGQSLKPWKPWECATGILARTNSKGSTSSLGEHLQQQHSARAVVVPSRPPGSPVSRSGFVRRPCSRSPTRSSGLYLFKEDKAVDCCARPVMSPLKLNLLSADFHKC